MRGLASKKRERMYAIAARDGEDLFLVARVHRDRGGEVFVGIPRKGVPRWDPHSSYHADGKYFVKTHNLAHLVQRLQRPDANFKGTFNMSTIPIAANEPRETNSPCRVSTFDEVFEIPISELSPEEHRTMLSVDLIEPGEKPIKEPGKKPVMTKILRQKTFQDAIPWICVTLYDTLPSEP